MKVDVSEIKCFRECKRKHQFSSRNRFHLRPVAPNDNLVFGTQFHEVLHMMYLGTDIDKILEFITKEVTDAVHYRVMCNMAKGYFEGPYQQDKERFQVLDIERSFSIPGYINPETGEVEIEICGSIDMVCIDKITNELVGFEHKTSKNFRPEIYNIVDEQPRMYSIALRHILDEYHNQGKYLDVKNVGPIYLNQVKKLQVKFAYERVECKYSDQDLNRFLDGFIRTAKQIYEGVDILPEPGFMKCQMCDYATLCEHYGYCDIDVNELTKEFENEFIVRECDHLEEKVERSTENT